ncbi:aldehyde dehydrogenase family protein [Tsukamurella sp. NPDC003166]|uniref:aldehyde dehydrogenase family protein n=1 Tax=Tsukamurella sp. NPDC003166 TaxID=3154444 RepID=UPI0033BF6469
MVIEGIGVQHVDDVFIGGAWRPATGERRTVLAPATGAVVGEVTDPSPADAAEAVAAADAARGAWADTPLAERIAVCGRWLDDLDARAGDLDVVWAIEAGMPVRHGKGLYRFATVPAWKSVLDGAPAVLAEVRRGSELGEVVLTREPVGVVVGILPYNGPIVTVASKIVPALIAGCPVVIKAAPESHLTMAIAAEAARTAGFPAGVVSVLAGGVDVGRALTRDPRVDMVSLTGGHVAAQDVLAATHGRYARTQLELGGKSAAIILDDAPLDKVLRQLVPGATGGAGQVCALLSRVLVSDARYDEVVEALKPAWERLRIGDPLDTATHVGPLINAAAVDRTRGFVQRALADGARLVAGGGVPQNLPEELRGGSFHEPTLFADVAPDSDLAQHEVFGPVTAVIRYADVDDAVRIANGTDLGLSGSVFAADTETGIAVARRIRSGSVGVNAFGPAMSAPFGGRKASGWGREAGPEGILGFTEGKQILVGG